MMKASQSNNNSDLKWIFNLIQDVTQEELQLSNMRSIKIEQLSQLNKGDDVLREEIYCQYQKKFCQCVFLLLPNLLLLVNQTDPQHLILSNCTIIKRKIAYKSFTSFCIILSDQTGNTFLFFQIEQSFKLWYKQLKQYCKLNGFLNKYKLGEKISPGFYECIKKRNSQNHLVQIYKMEDFDLCPELLEVVNNEIHILRSIKHQSLLELIRVYEDSKYLFIVYENFKGQSLFALYNQGLKLHEVQIASITYQILHVVKFLNQHQFYHGNINPQNILINTNNQMLQITLVNLSFKEYKVNDKLDWILARTVDCFMAPEIFQGFAPNLATDLYSIGAVMYFMTFYAISEGQKELKNDENFFDLMEKFEININLLDEQEKNLSRGQGSNIMGVSQLDLARRLLERDAVSEKRFKIQEASKHHWFVNIKTKLKKQVKVDRKRKKALPSLKTIIELREQSEQEVRLTIIQQSGFNITQKSSKFLQTDQSTDEAFIQDECDNGKAWFTLNKQELISI